MRTISKELLRKITFKTSVNCLARETTKLFFVAPKECLDLFGYQVTEEDEQDDIKIVGTEIELEYPADHPEEVAAAYAPIRRDDECEDDYDILERYDYKLSKEEIEELLALAEGHEPEDCDCMNGIG